MIQWIELSAMNVRIGAGKVALLDALWIEQEAAFHAIHFQQLVAGGAERQLPAQGMAGFENFETQKAEITLLIPYVLG